MLGLGVPELIVILIIAVLIFGPKRLPELGQNLGKAIREFKKSADELRNDVTNSTGLDEKGRQELKEALNLEDVGKDIADVGKNIGDVGKNLHQSITLEEAKPELKPEPTKEEVKS